jgi:hypothetical protein
MAIKKDLLITNMNIKVNLNPFLALKPYYFVRYSFLRIKNKNT